MKSRYGFWLLSICWISLAGCANWQNRASTGSGSPGSAASLSAAPAPLGSPIIQGPETSFGEPPPPVPPGPLDPSMNLAPLGSPSTQKLNLASPGEEVSPSSGEMYNLKSSTRSSSGNKVASSSKSSEQKSSTLSRLAKKAGSDQKSEKTSSKTAMSTIDKLSKNASKETEPKVAVRPAPKAEDTEALPVPAKVKIAQETSEEDSSIIDTTLLAQPVRKGADTESSKSSNGPQSNLGPKQNMFKDKGKPAIYPVSNPVAEEPVDIIEFS